MCRLFAFRSTIPSQVHRSLMAAKNALAVQSRAHPDGWGVAYYIHGYPHLFRSACTAIHDRLFHDVSAMISTHTLMAHVRKATSGDVNLINCHPFQHANWTFMHNGAIDHCVRSSAIYNAILREVDPTFQRVIAGSTDSELCFHLFLSNLHRYYDCVHQTRYDMEIVCNALKTTVETVQKISLDQNGTLAELTFVFTNGHLMLGLSMGKELHYSTHPTKPWEKETFPAWDEESFHEGPVKHLVLSSEDVAEDPAVWTRLHHGEVVGVDHQMYFFKRRLIADPFIHYETEKNAANS